MNAHGLFSVFKACHITAPLEIFKFLYFQRVRLALLMAFVSHAAIIYACTWHFFIIKSVHITAPLEILKHSKHMLNINGHVRNNKYTVGICGLQTSTLIVRALEVVSYFKKVFEPRHDKTNIMGLRPAWIQTSLRIRAV
jgi:hypothetical protein